MFRIAAICLVIGELGLTLTINADAQTDQSPPADSTPTPPEPATEPSAQPPSPELPAETPPTATVVPEPMIPSVADSGTEVSPTSSDSMSRTSDSAVEEDFDPTVPILSNENLSMLFGGVVQMHFAPWVGDDAYLENGEPAAEAGFRLRRARFGVETLFTNGLSLRLAVNLLETDEEVGTVSDAKIQYRYADWLRISVGTGKLPLARGDMESSKGILSIERPASVSAIAPGRRLGTTVEGDVLDHRLTYLVAFMNGTEGFKDGNQFGGYLTSGRLQYAIWGDPNLNHPNQDGLGVGAGALYENGPGSDAIALAADIFLAMRRAFWRAEAICDQHTPDDAPITAPGVPDELERCGANTELAYSWLTGWKAPVTLQPTVRVEIFDDNRDLQDAGDTWLISGGVNANVMPGTLRAQLHYLAKRERYGAPIKNDALILALQGIF